MITAAFLLSVLLSLGFSTVAQAQTSPNAATSIAQLSAQTHTATRFQSTLQQLESEAASSSPRAERARFELYCLREKKANTYLTMNDRMALMERYNEERTRIMRTDQ